MGTKISTPTPSFGRNHKLGKGVEFSVDVENGGLAKYTLLVRRGKILTSVSSSFLAEAVALEWGLQYLIELFKGKVTATAESQ